jgi:hypothetical protein
MADLETRELPLKTDIVKEDIDWANQRTGELLAEGFPPWEAMSQAWEEATGRPYKLGEEDHVRLVLLRAVGDEDVSSPSFQKEIAGFASSLEAGGVTSRANWITQDSAGGWCGYTGVISAVAVTTAVIIRALSPALVAYLKGRAGRKVQIEFRGTKLKIDGVSPEEIDRALKLFEQQIAAQQQPQIEAKAEKSPRKKPGPKQ